MNNLYQKYFLPFCILYICLFFIAFYKESHKEVSPKTRLTHIVTKMAPESGSKASNITISSSGFSNYLK